MISPKQLALILLGVGLASVGIKGFLIPNHFIDGGVTGIAMLSSKIFEFKVAFAILLINTPFVIVGVKKINVAFATRSTLAILLLSVCIFFLNIPSITHHNILSAIFGGISLGAGIGFALRGGAVLDGTEIAAILISRKFKLKIGDTLLLFNSVLFAISAYFLGINAALFSVLTYLSASYTINQLVYGQQHTVGINIISSQSQRLQKILYENLQLGITIYEGRRGFTQDKQDILFCVCSEIESLKVESLIQKYDPQAFISISPILSTFGGLIKKKSHLPH